MAWSLPLALVVAIVMSGPWSVLGAKRPPSALPVQQPARIFRYIDVSPYGVIRLGEAFPSSSPLGVQIRPRVFRLDRRDGRPVQLADTRAILVALTPHQWVCAFHFLYLPEESFNKRIAEYVPALGEPVRTARDSAGTHIEIATWQDSRTRFHIRRATTAGDTVITSLLEDITDMAARRQCAK